MPSIATNTPALFNILLGVSSIAYLAKITSYSPIYIFAPLIICIQWIRWPLAIDRYTFPFIFLLFCIVPAQILRSDPSFFINFILSIFTALSFYSISKRMGLNSLLKSINIILTIALLILFSDSAYRILNPGVPENSYIDENVLLDKGDAFYLYKYNSIMFLDSNTTALIALCFYFLAICVKDTYRSSNKNISLYARSIPLLYACLIILSFSRASIFAFLVVFLFRFFNSYAMRMLLIFIAIIGISSISVMLSEDGSFLTKLFIYQTTFDAFTSMPLFEKIFGIGFGNTIERFKFSSHSVYVEYLIGSGLFGFIVFLTVCFLLAYKSSLYVRHLLLALCIASSSYFLYAGAPFVFFSIAAILAIHTKLHIK